MNAVKKVNSLENYFKFLEFFECPLELYQWTFDIYLTNQSIQPPPRWFLNISIFVLKNIEYTQNYLKNYLEVIFFS